MERGTTADDGDQFIKTGIQPNVSRRDDVIKADIYREDAHFVKGRVLPVRPIQVS